MIRTGIRTTPIHEGIHELLREITYALPELLRYVT